VIQPVAVRQVLNSIISWIMKATLCTHISV
jgi:hypothetical protein